MSLGAVWYVLLGFMLTAYVVLDGFDLGAGAVLGLVAKNERERRLVIHSLGPVWDGNEVWLLAAGGVLVLAFPRVYAAAFAGFYLPLMLVLWLLVLRALSIELHHHIEHTLWRPFWDLAFSASSALLAVFFGAALGNVVRGVDPDSQGRFFNALFTNFGTVPPLGILDWYTVLAGLTSLAALSVHGSLWLNLKTTGAVQARASRTAKALWPVAGLLYALLSLATFHIQPLVGQALRNRPWGWLLPFLALFGAGLSYKALRQGREGAAFGGSVLFLAGLLGGAAFGIYPALLPSAGLGPAFTVANSASGDYALSTALGWWIPGMALVAAYFVVLYRSLPRKFEDHD
jgi:cytochrome d ubiquinol oxidase subunit II